MPELSEEALDQVAIAVKEAAKGIITAIAFRRDVGETAIVFNTCADGVAALGRLGMKGAALRYGIK